jgi:hypothetical protein
MSKSQKRQMKKGSVSQGFQESSTLRSMVKSGLTAIDSKHLSHIDTNLRSSFHDSIDLDSALKGDFPQENRWDYLVGHLPSKKIVGLEPHSATNGEIDTVIRKRKAAIDQLRGHLQDGTRVAHWFWVASGKTNFLSIETANLRLSKNGITFVGGVLRQSHLQP